MGFTEKLREVCEQLGWSGYESDEDTIELGQYTPAGEDFSFAVNKDNFEADIRDYAFGFDPEEHAEMWVMARQAGTSDVPSPRTLVDDADALAGMLDDLADAVHAAAFN